MRILIAAGATLVLAAVAVLVVVNLVPHTPLAPDFALRRADGGTFRLAQERGRTVALFFGYAHCPDVCPTTLAALARAKRKLGARAARFDVVFVTVDPQRDTPSITARYVRQFDPSFVGLSGTPAQLDPVYTAYRVYHQALPAHGAAGYLVAHSSTVTFVGPNGRIRGYGDWSDTPDELAAEIRNIAS